MGATIVVGAQWGDEAKGLISAYLNARDDSRIVCRGGTGPNAEHGIFLEDRKTYVKVNQLPLGFMFNPRTQIRIGSGVAVNPDWLFKEANKYGVLERVKVDYRCPIVTPEHIEAEKKSHNMASIGSTFSGTGYCRSDFVMRTAQQAKDIPALKDYLTDIGLEVNEASRKGTVVIESSQGTLLSLAVSPDYPNVTSDNVTAMAAADDVLLNWKNISEVMMVVKAMPSREGAGSMGVAEMPLEEIKKKNLVEISSIGGAIRRKALGIDWDMLHYAAEINGATQVALTFCEHYDPEMTDVVERDKITDKLWKLIRKVEEVTGAPVTILNTGKPYKSIIDLTRAPGKVFNFALQVAGV